MSGMADSQIVVQRLIADELGLTMDFARVRDHLEQNAKIAKAVLAAGPVDDNNIDVVAFIELAEPMQGRELKQFIHLTSQGLSDALPGFVVPAVFVLVDNLQTQEYSNLAAQGTDNQQYYDLKLDHWLDSLEGIAPLHSLPLDKMRQVKHKPSRLHLKHRLESSQLQALQVLCGDQGLSLFGLMQSLFSLLVGRYGNVTDIVIGAKLTGIQSSAENTTVNLFSERLILRNDISDNPDFIAFVRRNEQIAQRAFSHRNITFEQLLDGLGIDDDSSHHPVYQLMFHYQHNVDEADLQAQSSTVGVLADSLQFKYDLELNVVATEDSLTLNWLYNANLFNQDTINRLSDSYNALLEGVLGKVEQKVFALPLLNSEQQQQLQARWNNTANEYPEQLFHQLFEAQVKNTPDAVAVHYDRQSLSYAGLNAKANRIAHLLLQKGVKAQSLVGLCMERSPLLLASIIAIFKAGASYLPLDPSYPKSRLSFMLRDSKVPVILSRLADAEVLAGKGRQIICLDDEQVEAELQQQADDNLQTTSAEQSCAYVMYTSGSTGQPKGVVGTHKSLVNRLCWMRRQYPVDGSEVFCARTTISFVDHIAEMLQPLICSASVVLLDDAGAKDIAALAKAIDHYRINRITLVPSMLMALLESKTENSLNSIKYIMSSGEPLHFRVVELFHQVFGADTVLLNLYGSTEVGADVTCYQLDYKEQSNVLKYFKELERQSGHNSDRVEGIFDSLSDLSGQAQDSLFTRPNVPLQQLMDKFRETGIPGKAIPLADYLDTLKSDLLPYIIDVSSEKYIGHMTSALPNFIPEFSRLIAKYNQNIVKIETSKSMTLMERQVLAMLHRLFYDRPDEEYEQSIQDPFFLHGIITSGGSLANITSLYCARNKGLLAAGVSNQDLRELGSNAVLHKLGYQEAVILVSRLAHYSVKKAAALLGIGQQSLIIIEQDENQKIKTEVLEAKIQECRDNKRFIIAIIGIAGATETGTIDPLEEMADIAEVHNIHFHADAAWGGAFMFSDRYKHKLKGIERADSITFCAHKQLYLAQGISLCVFKDPKSIFAITTHADYQASVGSFDLGQFTIEGSRPASSLQLHASLHLLGKEGYGWLVDQGMEKTAFFRRLIEDTDAFELVGNNDLNIINYRYVPVALRNNDGQYTDEQNEQITEAVMAIQQRQFHEGKTFVSHTKILHKSFGEHKISVFRVVLTNPRTSRQDLYEVLQDQLRIAAEYVEHQPHGEVIDTNASAFEMSGGGRFTTPIGKPVDNVQIYLLDSYLNPVPIGVTGELYVAGDCLAEGYLNHDELTAECFVDNPFGEGKLYKSGDLARRLSNGNIEFSGRHDHQVKIQGLRVEMAEIELQLCESPKVKQAVVMSRKDYQRRDILVAYIVCKDKVEDSQKVNILEQVQTDLASRLPAYMIPSSFKLIDSVPLTPNGKVDFNHLALN